MPRRAAWCWRPTRSSCFAHWITDRDLPRRFDVPFLVARMPEGQSAGGRRSRAVRAGLGAARRRAGAPRGRQLLHDLPDHPHAGAAGAIRLGASGARTPAPASSRCGPVARARASSAAPRRATWSMSRPIGELALVSPDGQIVHHLDWRSDAAGAAAEERDAPDRAQPGRDDRARAPTATSSATPATGYIVIDPGPNEPEHLAAAVARGRRRHPHDRLHAFASRPFARAPARCRPCAHGKPPILGLPSAPTARAASEFTPDRVLADGRRTRHCDRRRRCATR